MHKSNFALYLSKPPRLGVTGWKVQASSYHCKLLHAQQLLGYSENEANTTSTDKKDTDCFLKCLTLNKYFKDIKFTKISVNIQQTKI